MTQTITGFLDLDAQGLAAMGQVTHALGECFAGFGYARVEPPVIDWPDSILERSGEDTRRRVYMFDAPDGGEWCLRPELTVPVCRLALRAGLPVDTPLRLSYAGPVFRHETLGSGRWRQFTQAGIERLGPGDPVAADAEVVAVAVAAARAAGLDTPGLVLGDVRFFLAVLDHYPLPERLKIQLRRDFLRAPALRQALSGDAGGEAEAISGDQANLIESVTLLGQERAVRLIESFLSVAEINPVGNRGIDEIVERLIEAKVDHVTTLPRDMAEAIEEFLAIRAAPGPALDALDAFGRRTGVAFGSLIEDFRRRIGLIEAHGVDLSASVLTPGLKRDLEYYTGFIFDLHAQAPAGGDPVPLGGGGRYDQLVASLDAERDTSAAGFALTVERLMVLGRGGVLDGPLSLESPVHAHVVAATPSEAAAAVGTARTLREAGWRVALDIGTAPGAASVSPRTAACTIEITSRGGGMLEAEVRHHADGIRQTVPLANLREVLAVTR
ncbi:MAG: ATP phosphoribosyltransferase regulatory subunit [Alphaproteobacteria bacterium]